MAKISARGDREAMRWQGERGREVVLTVNGRLLHKAFKGESFTLVKPKGQPRWTAGTAGAQAAMWGLSPK